MVEFEEANKTVHPVEKQWHFPILTKYGFTAVTKEATGFVRSYDYEHPIGHRVCCATGYSSDHWRGSFGPATEEQICRQGYWSDLEPRLKEYCK